MEQWNINYSENWQTYYARFKLFLVANDVQADREKAVFFGFSRCTAFDLLSPLARAKKVSELNIAEVMTLLTNHNASRPSLIVLFFKFRKREKLSN